MSALTCRLTVHQPTQTHKVHNYTSEKTEQIISQIYWRLIAGGAEACLVLHVCLYLSTYARPAHCQFLVLHTSSTPCERAARSNVRLRAGSNLPRTPGKALLWRPLHQENLAKLRWGGCRQLPCLSLEREPVLVFSTAKMAKLCLLFEVSSSGADLHASCRCNSLPQTSTQTWHQYLT